MKLNELMKVLEHEAEHFKVRGVDPADVEVIVGVSEKSGHTVLSVTEATVGEGKVGVNEGGVLFLRGSP